MVCANKNSTYSKTCSPNSQSKKRWQDRERKSEPVKSDSTRSRRLKWNRHRRSNDFIRLVSTLTNVSNMLSYRKRKQTSI